jgi:hypothetical protein
MRHRAWIPVILAALLAAPGAAAAQENQKPYNDDTPLTLAEIRALVARAIADQHADDRAINEYDRTEHTVSRDSGSEAAPGETVDRVFPVGTGDVRVELDRDGKPTDAAAIEQAWRGIEKALARRTNPDDPAVRPEFQKEERRQRTHAEMVDAIAKAFHFQWAGRVTRDGRPMIELTFEPDPTYKSSARYASVFAHAGGTVWLDESSGQVARLEAVLRDDVPIGGGIIAKLYRGSWLNVTQSEVAPGVWLPVLATYDVEGRKFLFAASWRGQIDAKDYRRVGPPAEALKVVQREHGETISSERDALR